MSLKCCTVVSISLNTDKMYFLASEHVKIEIKNIGAVFIETDVSIRPFTKTPLISTNLRDRIFSLLNLSHICKAYFHVSELFCCSNRNKMQVTAS